ncbi:MAG: chemotaxis protein [Leptospiraceae bacterium]|nr:chemotaxis protein [Leptospiraceae bacterium]
MEKIIIDVLNAGIGLFQSGKEGVDKAKVDLEKVYAEISAKGSQDNSENAVKVRESVDKILNDIKEFSSVAGKNYDETRTKIIDNYNKIVEEVKTKMPEGKIEEIKAKIDEIAASIQKATSGQQA